MDQLGYREQNRQLDIKLKKKDKGFRLGLFSIIRLKHKPNIHALNRIPKIQKIDFLFNKITKIMNLFVLLLLLF